MPTLHEIVDYCDRRTRRDEITDFDGARNGLQIENDGRVTKVAASVDAGLRPFQAAVQAGVDFLVCHHGLFWNPPIPLTRIHRQKVKTAFDGNLALYGAHLPLDCHPEIGNNARLAEALNLRKTGTFLPYEGTDIATLAEGPEGGRSELAERLKEQFPHTFQAIEYGGTHPQRIAILTGSGQSAIPCLAEAGADTLITGELRQHHFNLAQELGLNLYPCGHYATETFGVRALAEEIAAEFDLPWTFLEQPCPL